MLVVVAAVVTAGCRGGQDPLPPKSFTASLCDPTWPGDRPDGEGVVPATRYGDRAIRSCEQANFVDIAKDRGGNPYLAVGRPRVTFVTAEVPYTPPNGEFEAGERQHSLGDTLFIGTAAATASTVLDSQVSSGAVIGPHHLSTFGLHTTQAKIDGRPGPGLVVGAEYWTSSLDSDRRTLLWSIPDHDPTDTITDVSEAAWIVDKPYDSSDWIGPQFANAGDVTGDGHDDIALITGNIALLPGPIDRDIRLEDWDLWVGGAQLIGSDRAALVERFDADGDGIHDLAPTRVGGDDDAGRMRIFYGPISQSRETADHDVMLGMYSHSLDDEDLYRGGSTDLGRSALLTPGDRNGDGYDDLLVADRFRDVDGQVDVGKIWFLAGPFTEDADIEDVAHAVVVGVNDKDRVGVYASEGDLNADGTLDLVAGADDWIEEDYYNGWPSDEAIDPGTRLFWGPLDGTVPFDRGIEIHSRRAGRLIAGEDLDGDGIHDLVMTDNEKAGDDDDPTFPTAIHIWYSSESTVWPRPWAPTD